MSSGGGNHPDTGTRLTLGQFELITGSKAQVIYIRRLQRKYWSFNTTKAPNTAVPIVVPHVNVIGASAGPQSDGEVTEMLASCLTAKFSIVEAL